MLILKASALQMRMDREGIPKHASKKFRTPPSSPAAQDNNNWYNICFVTKYW